MPVQFQTNKASHVINITPEFRSSAKNFRGKEKERGEGGARELQEIKHAGAAIRRAIRPALNPPSFFYHFALGDQGDIERMAKERGGSILCGRRICKPRSVLPRNRHCSTSMIIYYYGRCNHVLQFATLPRKLCALLVSPVVVRFSPTQRSPPPRANLNREPTWRSHKTREPFNYAFIWCMV